MARQLILLDLRHQLWPRSGKASSAAGIRSQWNLRSRRPRVELLDLSHEQVEDEKGSMRLIVFVTVPP